MLPIQDLLNRIRWDKGFGAASFEIGYIDHIERKIMRIPFKKIHFEAGNHFSFELENEIGEISTIPFHRVREVYQDGVLIWQRPDG